MNDSQSLTPASPVEPQPPAAKGAMVGIGSTGGLAHAESLGDKEETIYAAELYLLRKIAERASDLAKARDWPDFREICGGVEKLESDHAQAVYDYEKWISDGEG